MLRLRIANMTCGGCVKGVTATLREADPAARPRFDLERREVVVEGGSLDADRLLRALAADGWEGAPLPA